MLILCRMARSIEQGKLEAVRAKKNSRTAGIEAHRVYSGKLRCLQILLTNPSPVD